ncbi:MAG: beta-phosphoglucomutase, partial [Clostridia bacterium]|nr:beta-phosphoglucomutase [Clostridia bacterium]
WRHSRDDAFLFKEGAEMMLSIAQFAQSLTFHDKKNGTYHTKELMGPDEFHELFSKYPHEHGLRNNAYTNFLIAWVLDKANQVVDRLPLDERGRVLKKLSIKDKDLDGWRTISRSMKIIMSRDGIISQFEGYFSLKELDWSAYREKYGNIHRMDRILKAEGKSPDGYKVAKQADALMLFYLFPLDEVRSLFEQLGMPFSKELLRKNYDYYVKRTSHGSTLSKVVHCYIAHILGREKEAWAWYQEVLRSDVADTQGGTTREGIHTGVMASSIMIAVQAFAGLMLYEDRIVISPKLPRQWKCMRFSFMFQGTTIACKVFRRMLHIRIQGSKQKVYPLPIVVKNKPLLLAMGTEHRITL